MWGGSSVISLYVFKNGSYFDNVAASERARGQRRHAGLIEECVGVDGNILSEVILPMMNVDRRAMDGEAHSDEVLNKSQLYINIFGQNVIYIWFLFVNIMEVFTYVLYLQNWKSN